MRTRLACLSVLAVCSAAAAVAAVAPQAVTVAIKVALVDTDLSVKPVPKQRFEIVHEPPGEMVVSVTTSFTGECQTSLPPGKYRIRSVSPIPFGQRTFQWDVPFEVVASAAPVIVELSNDNATPGAAAPASPPPVERLKGTAALTSIIPSAAGQIFQSLRDGVVTLEAEGGHGSGFVVDSRGLIVTNQHVVADSRRFVADFDEDHRLAASVVVTDPDEDIAVLIINPKRMTHIPVVPLAQDAADKPAVSEGDPVYAIGSPLHQSKIITAGIVSKVETGVIITDVMIDHGNSGGPLLNASQEAVGINTFGEGRGVSGTIRIWKAMPLVDEARRKMANLPAPPEEFLPPLPKTKYPVDAMKRIVLAGDFDSERYHIQTKRFDVYVLSPPALCYMDHADDIKSAKGRQQRRKNASTEDTYDPVSDIKGWAQYVGQYEPTVRVITVPRIKPTAGSSWGAALSGSSAALHYRYQGDVDTLRLMRNGKEIQPLRLGRQPIQQRLAGRGGHMEDVAYLGYADYAPESFMPLNGEKETLAIEIVNEAKDGDIVRTDLESDMVGRIWQDLAPLRTTTPAP